MADPAPSHSDWSDAELTARINFLRADLRRLRNDVRSMDAMDKRMPWYGRVVEGHDQEITKIICEWERRKRHA